MGAYRKVEYDYNVNGMVDEIRIYTTPETESNPNPAPYLLYEYTYDSANRITQLIITKESVFTLTYLYTYDASGRMLACTKMGGLF